MLRRTWLKVVTGSLLLAFATRDWIANRAQAADTAPKVPAPPTPSTVASAIKSNDPDQVCAFALANPKAAAAASVGDKGRMLAIMRSSLVSDVWSAKQLRFDQPQYERAVVTVLRGTEARPAELGQLMDALGGKSSVSARMQTIQNPELRNFVNLAPSR